MAANNHQYFCREVPYGNYNKNHFFNACLHIEEQCKKLFAKFLIVIYLIIHILKLNHYYLPHTRVRACMQRGTLKRLGITGLS